MDAVLSHTGFRAGVHNDIRYHLRALYTDPRGGLLGMGVANWVVHSILLLAILRTRQRSTPASDPGTEE